MDPILQRAAEEEIDTAMLQISNFITDGMAEKFDDYRFACGQIAGLKRAKQILADLRKEDEV